MGGPAALQMYVQYTELAEPVCPYPILMWHGGGLTGVTWETAAVPHQNGVGAHGLGQLGVLDVHLERCRAAHSTEVS